MSQSPTYLVQRTRGSAYCLSALTDSHSCHNSGGVGLTNGICDVGSLTDCLIAIHEGKATADKLLDTYNDVRRRIFEEFVSSTAIRNMKLTFSTPEEAKKGPLAQICTRMQEDPSVAESMATVSVN